MIFYEYIFSNCSRHTLWSRQAIPRNIEIQHISSTPSIAHVNSFGQPAPQQAESIVSNTSSAGMYF